MTATTSLLSVALDSYFHAFPRVRSLSAGASTLVDHRCHQSVGDVRDGDVATCSECSDE